MRSSAPILCLLSLVGTAVGQGYSTGFETFVASATGIPAAGQDGFYVPAVAGTIDGNLHTYAGNTLGVPVNGNGGANFWGGLAGGGTAFARSQRAVTLPTGRVRIEYDVCCNYLGAVVPLNNIGSFSFQPSTNSIYVNLVAAYPLGVVFPPTTWDANVVARGATPPATIVTVLPNAAFQGLAMAVWHHWAVTIDMVAGTHVDFSITNGVTNVTTTYTPTTPLLLPVAPAVGAPLPTDFRLFTGGTAAGNVFAIDNLTITYGAQYTTFGAGCPGALGVPALAAAPGSLPKLGATLSVNLSNLPVNIGLMITGLSNTLASGVIPLPLSLASFGWPGCDLLVDPLVTDTLIGASNTATWNFAIPLATNLLGFELFNQGASLDTGPAGLAFSNGGRARVGL